MVSLLANVPLRTGAALVSCLTFATFGLQMESERRWAERFSAQGPQNVPLQGVLQSKQRIYIFSFLRLFRLCVLKVGRWRLLSIRFHQRLR